MNLPDAPEDERYTVVVRNLVLMCSIGIRRAEHGRKQRVRVSVALTATQEAGFSGDDRRRVINYEKVVAAIREIADSGHIDLCEGFAARVCDACFADPRVRARPSRGRKARRFRRGRVGRRDSGTQPARVRAKQGENEAMPRPLLVGIVNITADLFSDGAGFLTLPQPLHMPAVSRPRAPTSSNSAPLPAMSRRDRYRRKRKSAGSTRY